MNFDYDDIRESFKDGFIIGGLIGMFGLIINALLYYFY